MSIPSESASRTFTFLFTDLEGSTQLWEQFPELMKPALERHDALLRSAVESSNGQVVKTTGDGLMAYFDSALDGVNACLKAQRSFREEPWGDTGPLKVRMGLHVGDAQPRSGDYFGPTVNRAARLMSVAHGGQVLLSETTTALARDELPEGVSLLDLGRHLLKDIHRPERICQLVIEGLPSEFPSLRSIEMLPAESTRIPRQVGPCPYRGLSAFQEVDAPFYFGREDFVNALEKVVRTRKLVAVIVGSSGSGKSSALFAGLLPRLRQNDGYQFAVFRPGSQPFYSLAGALIPLLEPG